MRLIPPAALRNFSDMVEFTFYVYSVFSVVYVLTNKSSSSVLDAFVRFVRNLATPFYSRVHHLRSDEGTAHTISDLKEYCKITGK